MKANRPAVPKLPPGWRRVSPAAAKAAGWIEPRALVFSRWLYGRKRWAFVGWLGRHHGGWAYRLHGAAWCRGCFPTMAAAMRAAERA